MPVPTLDELKQANTAPAATPTHVPTLDELKQANPSGLPPDIFDKAMQWGWRNLGLKRFAQNAQAANLRNLSGTNAMAANLFHVLDEGSKWLSEKTGLSRGGAFAKLESYYRGSTAYLMQKAQAIEPGQTLMDDAAQIVTGLPMQLMEAGAAVATGGPVGGFAALGALKNLDKGPRETLAAAAEGAAIGGIFRATEGPVGRLARAATVGAGTAAVEAAAGRSPKEIALGAAVTGTLAGLSGQPRLRQSPRPEAIPKEHLKYRQGMFEEAKAVRAERAQVLRSQAAGETPTVEDAKPLHPAIEIKPRTVEVATTLLGRDYSDIDPPDRVFNLNLKRIEGSNDFKAVVADLVNEFRDTIDQARRGKIGHDQTQKLAEDLGLTLEQFLARRNGQGLNGEEAVAYRTLNVSVLSELSSLGRKIRAGKASDEDKLDFLHATALAEDSLSVTLGAAAEMGRGLDSFNIRVGPTTAQMRDIRELIRGFRAKAGRPSTKGGGELEEFADLVAEIDTPQGLAKIVDEMRKPTVGQRFLEIWLNSILSGGQTHGANMDSNLYFAGWSIPETAAAAAWNRFVEVPYAKLRGLPDPERIYFREATARAYGLIFGAMDGLKVGWKVFKTGNPDMPGLLSHPIKIDAPRQAWGGRFGKLVRLPSRALIAEDAFAQVIAHRQEIRALAMRTALSEKLSGRELTNRVSELERNPTAEMLKRADTRAREQTFTEKLGPTAASIQHFAESHVLAKIIAPFVRVSTNIMKAGLRRTPIGLAMEDVRNDILRGDAATRSTAIARMALGTGIMAWVSHMVAAGKITGSGPVDPELRKLWLVDNQPFSIQVGNEWVSYARLEPLSTIVGLAADMTDILGHTDDKTADDLATALVISFGRNVSNKTFLKGIIDVSDALSDPGRFGSRLVQNFAASGVPNIVAQANRTEYDPVLREANTTLEAIKRRLPGFSQDLPPVRNVWGEAVLLSGGVGPDLISPFYRKPRHLDKTTQEAIRVQAQLAAPERKLMGVELTPWEYSDLMRETGQMAKQQIDAFVATPVYDHIPDALKKHVMEYLYGEMRKVARERALARLATRDSARVREGMRQRGLLGELLKEKQQ